MKICQRIPSEFLFLITGSHCHLAVAYSDNKDQTYIIVIVVVLAIVVALIVITAVAICQVRRRRREKEDNIEMVDSTKADGTGDSYSTANAWYPDYNQDGTAPNATSKMEMELPEK